MSEQFFQYVVVVGVGGWKTGSAAPGSCPAISTYCEVQAALHLLGPNQVLDWSALGDFDRVLAAVRALATR